jgi:hypothetical protein
VPRNPQHKSLLTVVSATHASSRASSATFERPWENFLAQLWTALRDNHFPPQTGNISLWISFALSSFAHKKNAQYNVALRYYNKARSPCWLLKPASELAHVPLLPRLSWSRTVLLPSDTHRKPITSITAVLLPFVSYLLTLPP